MKMILEHILLNGERIIKYGAVNEKILLELKMTPSLYEHIEVRINYYDDEDMPYFNNWTDVEGMGYGWRWTRYEENQWHDMMKEMVIEQANSLVKVANDTLYFVYEKGNVKTYHFVSMLDTRYDVLVHFSTEDLF